ncbi:MAG: type II toxin-antitoxin system VapC family toxin [Verrucomicrobia bacterium]|nr:type II toxin-antitoxin system VapC family toxin [Verrucomicrobiota bacterium]
MVLVDANVLLDILTDDPKWRSWSEEKLLAVLEADQAAVNPIIYAELGTAYRTARELDRALSGWPVQRLHLPYEAAFPAAQAFRRYKKTGGQRRSPLPDFYIGAHAMAEGLTLLTRDAARYRTYFPKVKLISP